MALPAVRVAGWCALLLYAGTSSPLGVEVVAWLAHSTARTKLACARAFKSPA